MLRLIGHKFFVLFCIDSQFYIGLPIEEPCPVFVQYSSNFPRELSFACSIIIICVADKRKFSKGTFLFVLTHHGLLLTKGTFQESFPVVACSIIILCVADKEGTFTRDLACW